MQSTGTGITRESALATVEGSPKAVAAHDKAAWLALFAELSVIEDPVGSRPHVNGVFDVRSGRSGNAAADRFYDTFIAPNDIVFDVANDVVCGRSVLRDLDVQITMAPEVVVRVPMHLLYELNCEDGTARIAHLHAYWELVPMVRSLLALGAPALPVATALGIRQVRNLGFGGLAGFAAGARSAGRAGKAAVAAFADATRDGDADAVALLVENGVPVELPTGESPTPAEFVKGSAVTLSATKLLASGPCVSATLDVDDDGARSRGVGLFDFDLSTGRMNRVRLFWEPATLAV